MLGGFSTLLRPFKVVEFLLPVALEPLYWQVHHTFPASSLVKLRAVNGGAHCVFNPNHNRVNGQAVHGGLSGNIVA